MCILECHALNSQIQQYHDVIVHVLLEALFVLISDNSSQVLNKRVHYTDNTLVGENTIYTDVSLNTE